MTDRWLYGLRVADSLSLSLATMSVALTLSDQRGLDAYSRYVAVSVLGGALGGVLMYASVTVLGRRLPALSMTFVSASGRLLLALVVAVGLLDVLPLVYTIGFLVALSGVVVLAIFHSLTSHRAAASMRARGGLLAATAIGGLLGAPLAGVVVEHELTGVLVAIQVPGSVAGLTVAIAFRRAFTEETRRPGGRVSLQLQRLRPIAWRVVAITGLSYSLGALAPGIVADRWGPQAGGLAGTAYLAGAVCAAVIVRLAHRSRRHRIIAVLRGYRSWFAPTAAGTLLWLLLLGNVWLGLAATLTAGVLLFLVQVGFEQAAADLGGAEQAGPTVVVMHSVAALATTVALTVLPAAIDSFGLAMVVVAVAGSLALLAIKDILHVPPQHVP